MALLRDTPLPVQPLVITDPTYQWTVGDIYLLRPGTLAVKRPRVLVDTVFVLWHVIPVLDGVFGRNDDCLYWERLRVKESF